MDVFRISKDVHTASLRSSGSANRWNTKGQQVIYTGASRSLSSLELVVHRGVIQPISSYKVMVIFVADDDYLMRTVHLKELPANWRTLAGYSALQTIGSDWYTSQESLLLKVLSAIIIYECNYVINTEHPDFNQHVQLVRTEDYFWDSGLL